MTVLALARAGAVVERLVGHLQSVAYFLLARPQVQEAVRHGVARWGVSEVDGFGDHQMWGTEEGCRQGSSRAHVPLGHPCVGQKMRYLCHNHLHILCSLLRLLLLPVGVWKAAPGVYQPSTVDSGRQAVVAAEACWQLVEGLVPIRGREAVTGCFVYSQRG